MDLRDTKDVKALKVWKVFYIRYLLKENALVLPKNSLFVNYLQTKKVMQMSEFFFRVLHQFYLLLDKEEKVTEKNKT